MKMQHKTRNISSSTTLRPPLTDRTNNLLI